MGLEFESPAGHQKAAERLLFCVPDGDSKTCNATVRWTVARATDAGLLASKAFGNLPDRKQHYAPERDSKLASSLTAALEVKIPAEQAIYTLKNIPILCHCEAAARPWQS